MHPLDNPIWQALTTTHAGFAKARKSARKFTPEVSVLAGFPEPTPENYESLASVLEQESLSAYFCKMLRICPQIGPS
jgi:hypothetical protein